MECNCQLPVPGWSGAGQPSRIPTAQSRTALGCGVRSMSDHSLTVFTEPVGADKSVNPALEAKACTLAGWKGYTTNLTTCPASTPSPPSS